MTPYNAHRKRLRVLRQRGTYTYIDAGPVVTHIRSLVAAGMPQADIAAAASLARSTIHRYTQPNRKRIHADVAKRILAVTPGMPISKAAGFIPAAGTVRRIQALVAIGWPMRELSTRTGVAARNIAVNGRTWVTVETAALVEQLYDDLSMTPGPSRNARGFAADHGWHPPLAWDDETIDDPHAKPDPGTHTGDGWAARWENYEDLIGKGVTPDQAAERLGIDPRAAERRHYRKLERQRREGAA